MFLFGVVLWVSRGGGLQNGDADLVVTGCLIGDHERERHGGQRKRHTLNGLTDGN